MGEEEGGGKKGSGGKFGAMIQALATNMMDVRVTREKMKTHLDTMS